MTGWRWWYSLIADHPSVWGRANVPVAGHFLSHFGTAPFGAEEIQKYHAWFPRREGTITGEWGASYSSDPWVAPLLARSAPHARLLLLVRDPVERLRLGLAATSDNRRPNVGAHTADAVDRGYYGAQLRRLLEFFPPEQVLTLQVEQIRADVSEGIAKTYRFLGLDDSYHPTSARRPPFGMASATVIEDENVERRLTDLYVEDVAVLRALVPDLDLSLWPHFAHLEEGRSEPDPG